MIKEDFKIIAAFIVMAVIIACLLFNFFGESALDKQIQQNKLDAIEFEDKQREAEKMMR